MRTITLWKGYSTKWVSFEGFQKWKLQLETKGTRGSVSIVPENSLNTASARHSLETSTPQNQIKELRSKRASVTLLGPY